MERLQNRKASESMKARLEMMESAMAMILKEVHATLLTK